MVWVRDWKDIAYIEAKVDDTLSKIYGPEILSFSGASFCIISALEVSWRCAI